MQADKHICEVQWRAGNEGVESSFSLVFAVESEMRVWASKIEEYRMMAILMAEPKSGSEELNSPMDENKNKPLPEGLTAGKEPWKRYGLIK